MDSDEEEEYKIQEEYSQMNLSEMKQEYMELEDFVEELSRSNSIKKEQQEGDESVSIECPTSAQQINENVEIGDVFEEIIANADKSYAEKSELIKNSVPDVGSFLMKDVFVGKDDFVPMNESKDVRPAKKEAKKEPKESKKKVKEKGIKSSEGKAEATKKVSDRAKIKKLKLSETTVTHSKLPGELHVEIRLPKIKIPDTLAAEKVSQNSSIKSTVAVPSNILNRRNTFVPSSTLSSGPKKRPLEIINAPHMVVKRRKSISGMSETLTLKPQPKSKKVDKKWLSKKVPRQPHEKRKEITDEIRSKLAALVPKDKVIEPKINRTNTKVPVKNTHKTRSDQLTDTIVKSTSTPTPKHKIIESVLSTEQCKILRMTENEIEKPKPSNSRRRSVLIAEVKEKPSTDVNGAREHVNDVSNNISSALASFGSNANNSSAAATATTASPVVKSILKKTNSIQKRRVTVTFSEDTRIKPATIVSPPAPSPIKNDEENIDDIIHNIMTLGMCALKDTTSTTINGKNFSYKPVAHEYESLRHLQK